jgi:anti-anti-sigma factor
VEKHGKELVVRASGELDIASAKRLEEELLGAIDSYPSAVVLDLGGVSFADSTGLRTLFLAAKRAARNDVPLELVGTSAAVRAAMESGGLHRVLPLAD